MNEAKFLSNKAIFYLRRGDAFEACNFLTEASSICLAEFSRLAVIKRTSSLVVQWVNVENQHHHRHPPSSQDDDDSSHHGLYHFAPVFDNVCACSHRRLCDSTRTTTPPPSQNGGSEGQPQTNSNATTTNSCSSTGKKRCRECIDEDAATCLCTVAPIVWYNLALTCQMLGGELGGKATADGSFYLSRSIYWYEKVLNIWKSTSEPNTLIMAIWNNVACIYLGSGRHEEYQTTMLRLRCSLQNISRPWGNSSGVKSHWRIFRLNLSLMNIPRPAAAA